MNLQSFWQHPDYLTFKNYTTKLEKEHMVMSEQDLKSAVKNWHRGVEKMTQIAIGYDIEFKAPNPGFLSYSMKDAITWVTFKKEPLQGFTVGLWDGPNRTIDGKAVFDPAYLDMERSGVTSLTELDFTDAVVAFLDIMRKFDGVVVPNVKEMF